MILVRSSVVTYYKPCSLIAFYAIFVVLLLQGPRASWASRSHLHTTLQISLGDGAEVVFRIPAVLPSGTRIQHHAFTEIMKFVILTVAWVMFSAERLIPCNGRLYGLGFYMRPC